jgi:hypothetical protein
MDLDVSKGKADFSTVSVVLLADKKKISIHLGGSKRSK